MAVLSDLLRGEWSVARAINGAAGTFTGTATFSGCAAQLWWRERGELRLGEYVGEAWRVYRIVLCDEAWEVRFDDGRPFHELDLSDGRCEVQHLCGPDTYRGVYALHGRDRLSVTWHVTGPGRDDVIASDYRRLGSGSGVSGSTKADR